MNYLKMLSFVVVGLFLFSTFGSVFASTSEKNADDMNNFDHYTVASKVVYAEAWYKFRADVGVVPDEMHTLKDIKSYFDNEKHHLKVAAVNTSIDNLKPGDIVHVKNNAWGFLIYRGLNTDGNIVLESVYDVYSCSVEEFNLIFDGAALKYIYTAADQRTVDSCRVDGEDITDIAVYDSNLPAPTRMGVSQYMLFWNAHQFDPNSSKNMVILELANQLVNGKSSDLDKAQSIFNWVQNNIQYNGSTVGSTRYVFEVRADGLGNSCDQARLVYALASFSGLKPQFHKALCQFPSGVFEHVWTDITVNDKYLSADTTNPSNSLGNTKYSTIIDDYGRYNILDC